MSIDSFRLIPFGLTNSSNAQWAMCHYEAVSIPESKIQAAYPSPMQDATALVMEGVKTPIHIIGKQGHIAAAMKAAGVKIVEFALKSGGKSHINADKVDFIEPIRIWPSSLRVPFSRESSVVFLDHHRMKIHEPHRTAVDRFRAVKWPKFAAAKADSVEVV